MANNTSQGKIKSGIASLFTLAKAPYLLIVLGIVIFMFFIAPFFAIFSNQSPGSGPMSEYGGAQIPAQYIPIYQKAEQQFKVPWNVLAAVHKVETNYGQISPMLSPVGAMGHMQFMCRTWVGWSLPGSPLGSCASSVDYTDLSLIKKHRGFGIDGDGDGKADPFNPVDAIFTAAKYLASNGAANGRVEEALLAYNHSSEYVQKVMGYAVMFVDNSGGGGMVSESGLSWPVPCTQRVTSGFGMRLHPIQKKWKMHDGIDIANPGCNMSPIIAATNGTVTFAGTMGTYGIVVFVDHGNGMQTRYAHLAGSMVSTGQHVKGGQTVGLLGTTGGSSGPHLHYEIRMNGKTYDPMKFYQK